MHLDGVLKLLQLRGGFKGVQRKAIEGVMVYASPTLLLALLTEIAVRSGVLFGLDPDL